MIPLSNYVPAEQREGAHFWPQMFGLKKTTKISGAKLHFGVKSKKGETRRRAYTIMNHVQKEQREVQYLIGGASVVKQWMDGWKSEGLSTGFHIQSNVHLCDLCIVIQHNI